MRFKLSKEPRIKINISAPGQSQFPDSFIFFQRGRFLFLFFNEGDFFFFFSFFKKEVGLSVLK
jgi:hypothetical protein